MDKRAQYATAGIPLYLVVVREFHLDASGRRGYLDDEDRFLGTGPSGGIVDVFVNGHVRAAERESGKAPQHDVDVRFDRQARSGRRAGRLKRKRQSPGDPVAPRDRRFASDHVSVHDLDGAGAPRTDRGTPPRSCTQKDR